MVGNKSGKRNCAPAIGHCAQHHVAIRGKSATNVGFLMRTADRSVSHPCSVRRVLAQLLEPLVRTRMHGGVGGAKPLGGLVLVHFKEQTS